MKTGDEMNINNVTNSQISFSGMKVKGIVSGKNIHKLGEYASQPENINFIDYLE